MVSPPTYPSFTFIYILSTTHTPKIVNVIFEHPQMPTKPKDEWAIFYESQNIWTCLFVVSVVIGSLTATLATLADVSWLLVTGAAAKITFDLRNLFINYVFLKRLSSHLRRKQRSGIRDNSLFLSSFSVLMSGTCAEQGVVSVHHFVMHASFRLEWVKWNQFSINYNNLRIT